MTQLKILSRGDDLRLAGAIVHKTQMEAVILLLSGAQDSWRLWHVSEGYFCSISTWTFWFQKLGLPNKKCHLLTCTE